MSNTEPEPADTANTESWEETQARLQELADERRDDVDASSGGHAAPRMPRVSRPTEAEGAAAEDADPEDEIEPESIWRIDEATRRAGAAGVAAAKRALKEAREARDQEDQ